MRDAIGGVFTLQIILVFVILINGYMAYSVNYTRAFRVKNAIINIIEENEGFTSGGNAADEIETLVKNAGYGLSSVQQAAIANQSIGSNTYCSSKQGYCVTCTANSGVNNKDLNSDTDYRGVYYTVTTYVNMDIPILNRIFTGLPNILSVRGDTKTVYRMSESPCEMK